jgi:hypothetical protein
VGPSMPLFDALPESESSGSNTPDVNVQLAMEYDESPSRNKVYTISDIYIITHT